MRETLFAFDERNYRDCQQGYRGTGDREYYLGDYRIEPGSVIDVRAERKPVGSRSLVRMRARTRQYFTRSWSHIRADATDVTVLWFVNSGRLRISHPAGRSVARAGDLAITRSMTPFLIECETGEQALHEALHVILPTHEFQRFVPGELVSGFRVRRSGAGFRRAEQLLADLFEDSDTLSDRSEELLLDSALSIIADLLAGHDEARPPTRRSLRDRRLADVLRHIDLHLSDPGLSAAGAAAACGISPRYLSALLRDNGTPFSELVWGKRLKIARRWLASSRPGEVSIAEIAFRSGFKSPAHFSRMFKRVYRQGPRAYREASLQGRAAAPAVERDCRSLPAAGTLQ